VDEPRLVELIVLFRRFRGDTSPFGIALQKVDDQVVDDMVSELYAIGKRTGLSDGDLPAVRIHVRVSLAMWETGVYMLLAEPSIDRALVVDMLARSQHALLRENLPTRPRARATRKRSA